MQAKLLMTLCQPNHIFAMSMAIIVSKNPVQTLKESHRIHQPVNEERLLLVSYKFIFNENKYLR
jgi:hypothetical protein